MTKRGLAAAAAALAWLLAPWVAMRRRGTLDEQRRRAWAQEGRRVRRERLPAPRPPSGAPPALVSRNECQGTQ